MRIAILSSSIEIICHWVALIRLLKRIHISTNHISISWAIIISISSRHIFVFVAPISIIWLQLCLYTVFCEFIIQELIIILTFFLLLMTYNLIDIILIGIIIKYTPLVFVSTHRRSTLKQVL